MVIVSITGYMGSGKTCLAVALAHLLHTKMTIYTNIHLKFPSVFCNNPFEILKSPDKDEKLLLIDEILTLADSRQSMSKNNRLVNLIATTSRKRHCHVIYTQQLSSFADIRLFQLTSFQLHCEKIGISDYSLVFYLSPKKRATWLFNRAPTYNLFDTHEIVHDDPIGIKSSSLLTKEYIELAKQLINNKLAENHELTKDELKLLLIAEGFNKASLNTLILNEFIEKGLILTKKARKGVISS